jgi:hypothetical protein
MVVPAELKERIRKTVLFCLKNGIDPKNFTCKSPSRDLQAMHVAEQIEADMQRIIDEILAELPSR